MKTEDGGKTWKEIFIPQEKVFFEDVMFLNQNIGLAFGRRSTIKDGDYVTDTLKLYRTTDAGTTWTKINIPSQLSYSTYLGGTQNFYTLNNQVWIADASGMLLRSKNLGLSWETIDLRLKENRGFEAIAFKDSLNGVAISSLPSDPSDSLDANLYLTTNGGLCWTLTSNRLVLCHI